MAASIIDFFDISHPRKFVPHIGSKVAGRGALLNGLDDHVVKDKNVAVSVLRAIETGKVDLFCQERIFAWLEKLHSASRLDRTDEVAVAFRAAMTALREETNARFRYRGYRIRLDKAQAKQKLACGGNASLISYGVMQMRFLANCEAYKHFGQKYVDRGEGLAVELPAKMDLYIVDPKDSEFAAEFDGRFVGGATIKKIDASRWHFSFDDYCLSTSHEQKWSPALWLKIFAAIQPIASTLFNADIVYKFENQFDN
jgi:hypothetical protein